jgi:hypothetical protein
MFHSRRIGQSPGRFAIPDGEVVLDRPDATTILGATKVTGKANGWSYGGLTAVTDREYARVRTAEGAETERLIEPYTSYNVARVQKDIRSGSSNIGGLFTGVVRQNDFDAFTASTDYSLRWDSNKYTWNGQWSGTRAAIDGEMKNGFGGVTNFSYNSKHVGLFGHYDYFSDTFKNSDLGFFGSRNNKQQGNASLSLAQPDPTKYFRSFNYNIGYFTQYNNDGLLLDSNVFNGVSTQFLNYWSAFFGVGVAAEAYDDLDTRGGPPIVKPGEWFIDTALNTDSRKRIQLSTDLHFNGSSAGSYNRNYNLNFTFQPQPQVQLRISGSITDGHDDAQWIKSEDVTGDGVTDYVYGALDRNVISITARGTYAFTRDMTLEVYLQPFVAVGDYDNTRRLAAPKSYLFEPVTLAENPDFNTKSLRSNVVFRWEYRRGSSLYLVYNVSNASDERPGVFSAFRDLRSGFNAAGTQVLMVKLSYWLGL